jgi:hypothetical protein
MTPLARIPFGKETHLGQDEDVCSLCGCQRGALHAFGCSNEECPECRQMLIGCGCDRLSALDSTRVIQGLASQFQSLDQALAVAGALGHSPDGTAENFSYLHHAAIQFIFFQLPQEARTEIGRVFQIRFPSLTPVAVDNAGHGYFSAEQLSQALGMPLAEVHERIEAMVTAGRGLRFADIKSLHKVH